MPRLAIWVACLFFSGVSGAEPLVIHQSGSFTVLQDDLGSIGGLNTDEEVGEPGVDHTPHVGMRSPGDLAPRFVRSAPSPAPQATMRLEQSELHVHLPPGETATFGISVTFRQGLLTRFSPDADVWINGQLLPREPHYTIHPPWATEETVSSLIWPTVFAGGAKSPAISPVPGGYPIDADGAPLSVGEQLVSFLSYRGLGHLEAPLRAHHLYPREVGLWVTLNESAAQPKTMIALPELWLADVRADGTAAVHRVKDIAADHASALIDDRFAETEYSNEALQRLRFGLHSALIADGHSYDEALVQLSAMDTTYFSIPGRRLLFLAPQTWTDAHLPLTISREARIVRSMVGCIELVTDTQEAALARIAAGPVSQPGWYYDLIRRELIAGPDGTPAWQPGSAERIKALFAGEAGVLQRLKVEVPEDYAAYLSLGRFRDALLIDHQQRTGDPELTQFRQTYLVDQISAMVNAAADGNGRVKLTAPPQK